MVSHKEAMKHIARKMLRKGEPLDWVAYTISYSFKVSMDKANRLVERVERQMMVQV